MIDPMKIAKHLDKLSDNEFISVMKEVGFMAPDAVRPLHLGAGDTYRTNGVDIQYLLYVDGYVYLNLFYSNQDGQGFARCALNALLMETDLAGRDMVLHAMPLANETDEARLIRFYQSFGFTLTGRQSRGFQELRRRAQEPVACIRQAWEASGLAAHPHFMEKARQALQKLPCAAGHDPDDEGDDEVDRPRFCG